MLLATSVPNIGDMLKKKTLVKDTIMRLWMEEHENIYDQMHFQWHSLSL